MNSGQNINFRLPILTSGTSMFSLLKVPIDSQLPSVQMGASKEMPQGNTLINFLCFLIPIIIMHNNEHS